MYNAGIDLGTLVETDSIRFSTDHQEDRSIGFDAAHALRELKHYLPSQTPLKDFIHHNSLHAFQNMKFFDAIFKASKIFGYQVTLQLSEYRQLFKDGRIKSEILDQVIARRYRSKDIPSWRQKALTDSYDTCNYPRIGKVRSVWKTHYGIDLDTLVQPLLFRVLSSYLDQGISIWNFPIQKNGFLSSLKELEENSLASLFKTTRARQILLQGNYSIESLLKRVVGVPAFYEQYLFDQQFSHQGWSGIVSSVEDFPNNLLDRKRISLHDLIVFELLLEIDALDYYLGEGWLSMGTKMEAKEEKLFSDVSSSELLQVLMLWQESFEWSYYDEVLSGILISKEKKIPEVKTKSFQALFCIDERECSIRRNIEQIDPHCETFGTPGFFGVEFYFQPENGSFYDKLCPAPVTPKYLIKEFDVKYKRKHELLYTKAAHTFPAGFFITLTLGFWSAVRLFLNLFKPTMSPAISNAFAHMFADTQLIIENKSLNDRENDLQVGFTLEEMATRVESVLRGTGLTKDFAPIIYAIAHGSSSANNPHHGAHDCGACSGRPGSVNARVFSFMANHPGVRKLLAAKDLVIPDATQFIGALHDTAADQIAYYDEGKLSAENQSHHQRNKLRFESALDLNAKERSRRFASINTRMSFKKVRQAIKDRSVSLFEPRPELGHGTNSLCIIGSRNLTKNLFLDRRAFMNSYDYQSDPEGKLLTGIMKPIGPVCGGISLEYYFSRVDNHKLGAGTKLPHNVVGLFGVTNGSDGDLRPGLPLQMIEVHDPVRLMVIVEHFPEVVLKTIQSAPEMYEWFINEWVHLVVVNPDNNKLFYFEAGRFSEYTPQTKIDSVSDIRKLIESAKEMVTNQIEDATKENLPVYMLT